MKLSIKSKPLKIQLPSRNFVLTLLLLFFSVAASAQLTVSMTSKTDETCPGNGTINLQAQNAQAGIDVYYLVYKQPDLANPIWNSTNPNVTGLTDGTYQVVAKQNATLSDPIEIIIEDHTQTITYSLTKTDPECNDGVINVTVTQGTPISYEIIAGPATFPPQPTPSFTNLSPGTYTVRVNDACGFGVTQSITLFSQTQELVLSNAPGFPDNELPACDQLTVTNSLMTVDGNPAQFPLTITITVYPPDGSTPVTVTGGYDPNTLQTFAVIPFYYGETYQYTITVEDSCNTYTANCTVNITMVAVALFDNANCFGKKLIIYPAKYVAPFTITFDSYPAGWDPAVANPDYPGPFTINPANAGQEIAFGDDDYECPYGTYTGSITDACGRTQPFTIEIEEIEVIPTATPTNAECGTDIGSVVISIPGLEMATAEIVVAPDTYPNPLPDDIMEFYVYDMEAEEPINELEMDLPVGSYVVVVSDVCGKVYDPIPFVIEVGDGSADARSRVDCREGAVTISVFSTNTPVTQVTVTAAPSGFPEPIPFDMTPLLLNNTAAYMDGLPPGSYTFEVVDACGTQTFSETFTAYQVNSTDVDVTLQCGSFDISLAHSSNAINQVKFWLQQYNETTGAWTTPGIGDDYTEGTTPEEGVTGMQLLNNQTAYSIPYNGSFRVLKTFEAYGYGVNKKICSTSIEEFEVPNGLEILDILNISCNGNENSDVMVNALGVEPLTYTIIQKNGEPFTINNGTSNTFLGLEPASYTVQVEDPCGNVVPMIFNVNDLPSLVTAYDAPDISKCDVSNDGEEEFNLAAQAAFVLGAQDPDLVTITFHLTQADAETLSNPLPDMYTSGNATIYARATHSANPDCVSVSTFELILQEAPILNMEDTYALCEGDDVTITAPNGFDSYEWSTGETTQSITLSEQGTYTITATNANGCESTKTISVTTTAIPRIQHIDITDWTTSDNTITVMVEPSPYPQDFEYSLDGIVYQDSPEFTGLTAGPYNVYVRDKYNCGNDLGEVYLLTYPRFFTPNGDGVNERWRIQYSIHEPDMEIYIFDRYGKLITAFGPNYEGWDGTFHGNRLPSTDYWFVVKRQDGRELKGHFSMVR
ncbi:T9SS type B sorting domain-containing protein [Flavobacterium alkalisoli]|uniref:T9SS type B sorting domain-containing protein n=1 Tax=Flavobacterium alkalisoli TaxID=2602769 RepID=A0A5B9FSN4_9FLAO|nr:T9SS type B sorting domain-containing protein [Flavobacterium alkalisoli]QEE50030.1 T9SS type B sorting domain-containing protein [Flavobacterium alkalisoli]